MKQERRWAVSHNGKTVHVFAEGTTEAEAMKWVMEEDGETLIRLSSPAAPETSQTTSQDAARNQ